MADERGRQTNRNENQWPTFQNHEKNGSNPSVQHLECLWRIMVPFIITQRLFRRANKRKRQCCDREQYIKLSPVMKIGL